MKERHTTKFRIANQRRQGRKKVSYQCAVCDVPFFSTKRRNYKICDKTKCRNYLSKLGRKIEALEIRAKKAHQKLEIFQTEYTLFIEKSAIT